MDKEENFQQVILRNYAAELRRYKERIDHYTKKYNDTFRAYEKAKKIKEFIKGKN